MDDMVSAEQLAGLWDRYVEVSRKYHRVKRATDMAEVVCQVAHDRCQGAYGEEVRWAHAVAQASQEFQAASDAAFLSEIGISGAEPWSTQGRVDHR